MVRILVVEDHENLAKSMKSFIENDGYHVDLADGLKSANESLNKNPDLIVLDWMLPDGQGIDFLTEIRKNGSKVPIIFLTARAELVDKILGLELGASDYMTKPFEPRELLARIRVRLREKSFTAASAQSTVLTLGDLKIDKIKHKVTFKGTAVDLVKKEFDLLMLLAESPEKVFSRDEILNKVWGYDVYPTTRTVDTHIMLLRQKIHDDLIETVRSVGYRLRKM